MLLPRRTLLAAAAAVPSFAIAQSVTGVDTRPVITIAVQKISNSGTLDPLREQSSNASERWVGSIQETLIARNQQGNLERVPGLATGWRRIDERTVELSLRPGVTFHNGDELTAEDVAFSFGPERMFGPTPTSPRSRAAIGRRWSGSRSSTRPPCGSSTRRRMSPWKAACPLAAARSRRAAPGRRPATGRPIPSAAWARALINCAASRPIIR
jgi:peptide/nickel transport system substrate-binding protein